MPRYIIDRFEGDDWAVLEDEHARVFTVPRWWLPSDVREGDVVNALGESTADAKAIRFDIDRFAREERRAEANRRRGQLPRGPKGDLSL